MIWESSLVPRKASHRAHAKSPGQPKKRKLRSPIPDEDDAVGELDPDATVPTSKDYQSTIPSAPASVVKVGPPAKKRRLADSPAKKTVGFASAELTIMPAEGAHAEDGPEGEDAIDEDDFDPLLKFQVLFYLISFTFLLIYLLKFLSSSLLAASLATLRLKLAAPTPANSSNGASRAPTARLLHVPAALSLKARKNLPTPWRVLSICTMRIPLVSFYIFSLLFSNLFLPRSSCCHRSH